MVLATWMANVSNSPRMRSAPRSRGAVALSLISALVSRATVGRVADADARDVQCQAKRKP